MSFRRNRSAGFHSLPLVALAGLLPWTTASLAQESVALSLDHVEAVPGNEFEITLSGKFSQAIRGFQVGFEFPQYTLSFRGASLEGTDLAAKVPDLFEHSASTGTGTVKLILDNRAPYQNGILPGDAVKLAKLRFQLVQGLAPGTEFAIQLKSSAGVPPLSAQIYISDHQVAPVSLGAGGVKVLDRNLLRIRDLESVSPGQVETLEISAFNIEPLQGFSIGVRFDPTRVRFLEADITDTITESVGAEYVAPIIDNAHGSFLLGVLLDSMPPFGNQTIPAAGLELTIAKVKIQTLAAAPGAPNVPLELVDGMGAPPIRNLFVVNNQSVEPLKQNGTLHIVNEAPFIRGDINVDGRVDISDPIVGLDYLFARGWPLACVKTADADDDGDVDLTDMLGILQFLFKVGPRIRPPYPTPGFDPTPDDLPCPAA